MRKNLHQWPEDQDDLFLCNFTRILVELAENTDQFAGLWEDVRCRKQAIADCAGNCDEQLMTLAQQTHFSLEEIELLRKQFRKMRNSSQETTVLDLKGFKEVVKEAVPEFPPELCGRLFQKLDCFGVGRLTFMELACGMSALALGTMDEKLQVCFDLFDSEGRRALTLKDLNDLCTTLFKVALSHGSVNRKASTDEVMAKQSGALSQRSSETDLPFPMTPPMRPSSVIVVGREKVRASAPTEITKSITMDDQELPSRSMLLRLLAAAKVHTPGGQRLVAYEDFCSVARMEPALLCLFSWCLPRPPERMPVFMFESTTLGLRQPGLCARVRRTCDRIRCWFRRRS
ncbi:cbpM [Symbiodinium sp. CCMP2456]|nr:cbpM [Symbiodinium sp. CCMP2456]